QYLGFRKDVPNILTAADMTVSVSLQEGFGLRVLESMACGRPCVTYDVGGIPEVMGLPEAQSWLIPPGDETAMARRLVTMINQDDMVDRPWEEILQAHARQFDVDRHVDQLSVIYQDTLAQLP